MSDSLKLEIRKAVWKRLSFRERFQLHLLRVHMPLRSLYSMSLTLCVLLATSAITGVRLSLTESPQSALIWSSLLLLLSIAYWMRLLALCNQSSIEGPWPCLPISDADLFYRVLRQRAIKPLLALLALLFSALFVFGLRLDLGVSSALVVSFCLTLTQSGLTLLVGTALVSKSWSWMLQDHRLIVGLAGLLIFPLLLPTLFLESLAGWGIGIIWLIPPAWPSLAVYFFPDQSVLMMATASPVLLLLSSWIGWILLRDRARRFTIFEFYLWGNSAYSESGTSYWAEIEPRPDERESASCRRATVDNEGLEQDGCPGSKEAELGYSLVACVSSEPEEFIPSAEVREAVLAEYARSYYQDIRGNRRRARIWLERWGLRRDEIELLELNRAGPLVSIRFKRLGIVTAVVLVSVLLLPENLLFLLPGLILGVFWIRFENNNHLGFSRLHRLPVDYRTAMLANLKYYAIHILPWLGAALLVAACWSAREGIAWEDFVLAIFKTAWLVAATLPCIVALASISQLYRRWISWTTLKWILYLLGCMSGAIAGGFGMMFLEGKWALVGAGLLGLAAWLLWELCLQYYENDVADVI